MTSGESAGLPIQCLLPCCHLAPHAIFVITFGIISVLLYTTILTYAV